MELIYLNVKPTCPSCSYILVKIFSGFVGIFHILGGSFNSSAVSFVTAKWKCRQFDRTICFLTWVSISISIIRSVTCLKGQYVFLLVLSNRFTFLNAGFTRKVLVACNGL